MCTKCLASGPVVLNKAINNDDEYNKALAISKWNDQKKYRG